MLVAAVVVPVEVFVIAEVDEVEVFVAGLLVALEVVCRLPAAVRGVDFWDLTPSQLQCEPIRDPDHFTLSNRN